MCRIRAAERKKQAKETYRLTYNQPTRSYVRHARCTLCTKCTHACVSSPSKVASLCGGCVSTLAPWRGGSGAVPWARAAAPLSPRTRGPPPLVPGHLCLLRPGRRRRSTDRRLYLDVVREPVRVPPILGENRGERRLLIHVEVDQLLEHSVLAAAASVAPLSDTGVWLALLVWWAGDHIVRTFACGPEIARAVRQATTGSYPVVGGVCASTFVGWWLCACGSARAAEPRPSAPRS